MYQSSGPLRLRGRLQVEERGGDRLVPFTLRVTSAGDKNAGVAVEALRRAARERALRRETQSSASGNAVSPIRTRSYDLSIQAASRPAS